MKLATIVEALLNDLDKMAEQHPEFFDTAVRDKVRASLRVSIASPAAHPALPERFGLFSAQGEELLRTILATGIRALRAELASTPPGERLELLTELEVCSHTGNDFDDYFGD